MKAPSEEIYTANERKEHHVEKYFQLLITFSVVADNTVLSKFV